MVVGSLIVSCVAACGEPGVTSVSPIMGGADGSATKPAAPTSGASTRPPTAATAGMTAPSTPPPPAMTTPPAAGAVAGPMAAAAGTAAAGASGAPATSSAAGMSGAPQAGAAAGSSGAAAGSTASAGEGGSGSSAPTGPLPCPSGWTCNDLGAIGLVAVDQDGNEITASCGNGAESPCDDADPKGSCPMLQAPFCAHLDVAGTSVVSCGQRCTP